MEAYNIASTTIKGRHISTAMVPRVIMECGEIETFETIIWEWDEKTKKTRKIIEMFSHPSEQRAKKEHLRFISMYLCE